MIAGTRVAPPWHPAPEQRAGAAVLRVPAGWAEIELGHGPCLLTSLHLRWTCAGLPASRLGPLDILGLRSVAEVRQGRHPVPPHPAETQVPCFPDGEDPAADRRFAAEPVRCQRRRGD